MRLRSFLLGLVTGVAVLGLSASPAKAQSFLWTGFGDNQNWLLLDNWDLITFPGDTNSSVAGVAKGTAGDTALIGAGVTAVGINFADGGGNGNGVPANARGRLTLAAFGRSGGTGVLTVGNSAVGTTAGEFNGILQLNGGSVGGVANTILSNTVNGQTLTIARNIVAGNETNADMAVRINAADSVIQVGGNATTVIDIQTQLVMPTAVDRRLIIQGPSGSTGARGVVRLSADNTLGYTAAFGQGTYVGLQGGFTVANFAALEVANENNLGIAPGAVVADHFQFANGTLRTTASMTLNANRGITLTTAGQAGTLDVLGAANTLTYDGVITGAGNFAKAGAGSLVLSKQMTYNGSTTISGGMLQTTGVDGSLPAGTFVNTTGATAILDIQNKAHTFGGMGGTAAGAGSQVLIGANNLTIDTAVVAVNADAFRGIVAGTGGLIKNGTGTTILAGANTYSGGTTINAGTLQLGNATATGTVVGGVLNNGNLAFNPAAAGNTFSEVISGTGTVAKLGANVQTLSGVNTYQGATSVLGGTLAVTSDGNLGAAPGAATAGHLVINGGTLRADGSLILNTNRGIALGPTTGSGTGTINVAPTFTLTYGGVMDDNGATGNFAKAGTGTLVLSAAQLYAGSTTVTDGLLNMTGSGANQLPGGTALIIGTTGAPVLDLNGNNQSIGNLSGGAAGIGQVLTGGTLTVNQTTALTYAGIIADDGTAGSLVKDGAATLTLSGANTFSGPITINAGTLQIGVGATGSIAGTQAISNAGTLAFNQNSAQTVSGVISGAGALTKAGGGVLTLSGANTYTGATTLTGGVLQAGSTSALGSNSAVNLNANTTTLQLNGFSNTVGSLATSAASNTRIVENGVAGAVTLTTGGLGTSTTFSGLIRDGTAGTLALTKTGAGTFTLVGTNTYTGGTTVSGGILELGNGTTNGAVAGNIGNDANVTFNPGTAQTYAGVISGTGSLTKAGANALTLSGVNTYAGATAIDAGTVTLSGGADRLPVGTTVTVASGANLNLNSQNQALAGLTGAGNVQLGTGILTLNQTAATSTISGVISGGGSVTKNGANTLILDGANTFTGGLTVGAGTVQVGTGGTTGALAAALPIANNGALVVNKSNDQTLSGAITGTGSLTKEGAGALVLGGANTYGGGTTINGGAVRIGAAGALPDTGTVTIGGGTLGTAPTAGGVGISETAGVLKTTGSTIELGTGVHTLTFSGLAPANELTSSPLISGWTGGHFQSGTQGRILFNNLTGDPNTTYSTWLSSVQFAGNPMGGFFLDQGSSTFELTPTPEPGTVLGIAAAGLAGLGLIRRRLRRDAGATVAA